MSTLRPVPATTEVNAIKLRTKYFPGVGSAAGSLHVVPTTWKSQRCPLSSEVFALQAFAKSVTLGDALLQLGAAAMNPPSIVSIL